MHAIGVDIGGTKIAAGVVDEDGTILAQTRRDTSPDDVAGIDTAIAEVYLELQRRPTRSAPSASPQPGSSPPTGRPCCSRRTSRGATTRCATRRGDPRRRRRADRRRERRQRGRLGRVPVRRRPRRRRHAPAHRRHRPRRRDRVQRRARARRLGRRRGDRAHARGARRPLLRLRPRGLLGAVRLGQRAGARRAGHRDHPARPRARGCSSWPAATPTKLNGPAGHAGRAGGRPARRRAARRARPLGRRGLRRRSRRCSTRRSSSSAAASAPRATCCSRRPARRSPTQLSGARPPAGGARSSLASMGNDAGIVGAADLARALTTRCGRGRPLRRPRRCRRRRVPSVRHPPQQHADARRRRAAAGRLQRATVGASRHATSDHQQEAAARPATAHHAIVSSGSPPRTGPGVGRHEVLVGVDAASASSICDGAVPVAPGQLGLASAPRGRTTRRSATQGATGNDRPACRLARVGGSVRRRASGRRPVEVAQLGDDRRPASSSVGRGGAA